MNTDDLMRILFLGLLAAAIGGSYFASHRESLGKMGQQAVIWVLLFVGVIAAYGLWGDISNDINQRQSVISDDQIRVPQANDGHFYLTLDINGKPVNFVVDTGASMMVLTQQDARSVGIDPGTLRYLGSANTANGVVRTADVWLDSVSLGPITDTRVRAVVNGGEMEGSLLGMSYLDQFRNIQFGNGELVLTR